MKIFNWLDGIEATIIVVVAAVLLVFGPLFIMYRYSVANHVGAGLVVGALWFCCVGACVRDFRRQRLSWVSGIVVALWLVTTLVLALIMA